MTRPCLFALLCLWLGHSARCQKIEKYYDFNWRDTTAVHARFYSLTEKTDSGWRRRDYYLHNLTLQMEGLYSDSACKIGSGSFLFFHPTRIVSSMGAYRAGRREGLWLRFYSDGTMEDSTVYVSGQAVGIRKSWWRDGYLRDSSSLREDGSGVEAGWFDNGQPSYAGRLGAGGKKIGRWQYFYKQGGVSATEVYDGHGRLTDKKYLSPDGVVQADTVTRDRGAEFPGGSKGWAKYLSRSLYFPDQYQFSNGDEAAVVVAADIDEEGRVVDAEVVVPFYPAFDRIALDAVRKSTNWIPAFQHNRKERTTIRQPVVFSQPN